MSRLGKVAIRVPSGVEVKIDGRKVTVKGSKGTLTRVMHEGIEVKVEAGKVRVAAAVGRESELSRLHGLERALINNMVLGVSQGWVKKLEIIGTGYAAKLVGKDLELTLGYSHPVRVPVPADVKVEVPVPEKITISGADREKVGELAAVVRRLRKPEPYKGKGIRYEGELVKRKAGKTMGATTA